MDDKKLKAAISAKRAEINGRIVDLQGEMHPADAENAITFYTGELAILSWVVEYLNTPEADPLAGMVGLARPVRRGRKA
jgi:hypothetical protein